MLRSSRLPDGDDPRRPRAGRHYYLWLLAVRCHLGPHNVLVDHHNVFVHDDDRGHYDDHGHHDDHCLDHHNVFVYHDVHYLKHHYYSHPHHDNWRPPSGARW